MSKLIDLTGQKFGKLTVIERAEDHVTKSGKRVPRWRCLCQCGRETIVGRTGLVKGTTTSCGFCKYDEKYKGHVVVTESGAKFIDLTGLTFGRLTVIGRGPDRVLPSGVKIPQWYARCSCGNPEPVLVDGHSLKQGNVKSCGCITREGVYRASDLTGMVFGDLTVLGLEKVTESPNGKRVRWWKCKDEQGRESIIPGYRLTTGTGEKPFVPRRTNRYEFHDEYVIGYDNNDNQFIFDAEDYDRIKDRYWRVDNRSGYVETFENFKRITMHRLFTGAGNEDVIDHLNHNTADNRKVNLRIVTPMLNSVNRKRRVDNRSGCTGVWYSKGRGRKHWDAAITVDKKTIRLGRFLTYEEAVEARKAAEEKYFGAYSFDNSVEAVPYIIPKPETLPRKKYPSSARPELPAPAPV